MEKMYALTYCFEGCFSRNSFATTIAISNDKDKLIEKMNICIQEDCKPINEDDNVDELIGFKPYQFSECEVVLQHTIIDDLYVTYKISNVEQL